MSPRARLLAPLGLAFAILAAGCTNPFDGGASTVDKGYQSGAPATLTALATSANFDQNTTSAPIALPYTGLGDVHPLACEIASLSNLTPASVCACVDSACAVQVSAPHNFNGAASFEFRLADNQGRLSNWATVAVTVNHVNQPPTIGPLAATTILADVTSAPIPVPVADIDSTLSCATDLSVVSADPAVIPVSGIQFSGSPPNCQMTVTPGTGQTGVVDLDLTITDGALTASAPITITVNPNPPGAPTSLAAAYAAGPAVALTWNASTGPGPITYTVYRSTLSGSGYAPVTGCVDITPTTCSDTAFVDGTDYYYVVRAKNLTATSTRSNEASINPKLPTAATLVKTSVTGGVTLSWSGSAGTPPLTYTVRRGVAPGGPYLDVVTGLGATTYADTSATPGTTYYYVVTTANAGGAINSNEISATALTAFSLTSVGVNGAGSVSLAWSASAGAATYRVRYGTTSGSYPQLVTATGTSPQTISGLTPGLTYYFRVDAENATDAVPSTNELSAIPMGAFSISSVVATSGQAVVTWGPSGGAAAYQVKYGTASGDYTTTFSANATSPTTVTGLANGATYYFMVTAQNASGTLDASAEVSAQPIDVPGAPTDFLAAATPGQVALTWTASTGPGSITYDVRRGTASGSYVTIASSLAGTSYTDTAVNDGTTYYYVVRARNAGGLSPNATEAVVRPISTFGITAATAGSGRVELEWSAATGATRYTVWRSTSDTPELTGAPVVICTDLTATACSDTSVTNGTPYYYVVIAANTDYPNSTSRAMSDEVSATPLVSPWSTVTAKTGQVEFTWLTNLLTPTPLSYTIRYSTTMNDAVNGPDLPGCANVAHPTGGCTGTGLTDGTRYYFALIADQGGGVTYVSDEVNARPISALTVSSAVAGSSTQVTVSWNDVVGETGYTVNYGTSSGSYPSSGGSAAQNATSRVVTGLTGGTTYYFRVTATNSSGFVHGTPEVSVTTPVFPDVPSGLALAITQASALDLSWAASTGTGPITYEVFRSTASGSGYVSIAAGLSATAYQDTGVNPGTTYYYVVRATGPGGTTAYSSETSGVALAAFNLTGLSATDDENAAVSWASSTGATAYTVKYGTASGVHGNVVSTNATSPQAIPGLTGGTTYYVTVTATNATGSLDATAEMSLTTPVRPAAPVPSLAITQASRLDVSWAAVTGTTPVIYTVERSLTSGTGFAALAGCTAQSGTSCHDAGVIAGTLYYYRVVASGPGGSATSVEISGRPLGAFALTAAAATSDTTATVSWNASPGAATYTLAYGTVSGTYGTTVTTAATSPQPVTGLDPGTTYYFMVTAVNAVGQLRATAEFSLTTPVRPAAPALTKTGVNAGVTLSWNQPAGTLPMSYDVKRSTVSGSGYTTISAGQSLTGYTDATAAYGTTYYYVVTATNPGGDTDSNEVAATPIATFNQTSATVAVAEAVDVAWPAVSGAAAYTLAYGTAPGGPYPVTVTSAATSPQAVTGLTGGTTYYFKVTATNATESQPSSNESSATAIAAFAITSVDGGHQSATVTWPATAGATGYDVAYGTAPGTYSTTLANRTSPAVVTGLTNGTTYYFRVLAKNADGSAPSSAEVARAPGLTLAKDAGDAQTGEVDAVLATPIRVRVTDGAGTPIPDVAVAWSVTSGGGSLSGCDALTDASGYAACDWRLGTASGANSVQAGITGGAQTVSFTATGVNAPAATLAVSGIPASVTAGTAHAVTVRALDVHGNVAVDYVGTIAFTSTDGAAVLPADYTFTGGDAGEKAFAGVSLRTAGSRTVAATDTLSPAVTGTHAAVTVTAAVADHLAIVAGDGQTATVGHALTVNPRVRLLDAYDNPVAGTTLTFTPSAGSVGAATVVTDAAGEAATSMTLGTTAGAQTLTVARQTTALPGSPATVTFNQTAVADAATALAFSTAPSASTVSLVAFAQQPVVDVVDAHGNRVLSGPDATAAITLNLQAGAGVLGGTVTAVAVAGRADFAGHGLNIDLAGADKVLRATKADTTGGGGTGALSADSAAFTITHAAAAQLAYGTQPGGGTAGAAWAPAPVARILDASGNLVTTGAAATADVTLAIANNPGGGTLGGTATRAAIGGIATFTGLSIDKVGTGYTLAASSTGLTGATSDGFDITVGAAAKLVFHTQPGDGVAGTALAAQPVVYVVDAHDNLVTGSTASVTLALGTNPGGGTLSGTATVAAVGGVATFSGLSIEKTGSGYTFTAASAGLAGATSDDFDITPAAATKLAFGTEPGDGVAGAALATQPVIQILDAYDNLVTGSTATVALAIDTNPGGGTLSGTASVAAVAGVATFTGLSIDKTGAGYTLAASSAGLTGATSAAFDVTPGAATKLVFGTEPGDGVAGAALATQPVIQILDAHDNLVTGSTATVTLAIGTNPGGGTLSGTASVAAVAGVATFSGLSVDKTGTGYTLAASSAGLTGATSVGFDVTPGAATKLAFGTQPGDGVAGAALSAQPVVRILDAHDNLVTSATDDVSLAIGTNPGGGTLSGTATLTAVAGVASFTGLSIEKTGTGYTLAASAAGLTGATSSGFDITPAAATKLAFGTEPGDGVAGAALSAQPVVRILDAYDNLVTGSTATVTLALGTNPGGGALSGTASLAATAGIATFSGLSIDKTGAGYTLAATSSGLTGATSAGFDITPAAAAKLAFSTEPGDGVAGAALSAQPVVRILDAHDNLVTSSTANVTLALGTNPGSGTLSGTATVAASGGIASFSGLSIQKTGAGYTLAATSGGLTGATSDVFDITPAAAAKLAFSTEPGDGVAGAAFSAQPVIQILDTYDNLVTGATDTVTLAITTNPGGGTLSGTASLAATAGVATFSNLSIDRTGTGYVLTASASGVTSAASAAFDVTPGAATKLAFSTEPGDGVAGAALSTQPVVRILDAHDNLVTGSTATVTLALGTNPGSGTLSGTASLAATAGVATFSNLSINKTGAGYTLAATSSGLTGATSDAFDITPGAAAKLAFSTDPGDGVAGAALSAQPVVRILDAHDNLVASSTASVTLALGTNPGGGTLSGTATLAATAGVVTFSGLSIEKTGAGYTLAATSSGLTGATSATFDITPAAATKLAFGTQPGNGVAGAALATQPVVRILDAYDNIVTSSTATIALAIGTNPGSGTLSGTASLAATAGVATFSGLSIEKTGAGYTLAATSAGLTGATSSTFNVTPGAATKLAFTAHPSSSTAGVAFATQPAIQILDAHDNLVTSSTASVTLAIDTNPGTGALGGTASLAATAGVATFAGLSINKTGTGYTLAATSAGLTGATSDAFDITPGAATKLAFSTEPGHGVAGAALSTQPVIRVLDANDNLVTGSTASVTLAIGTNPGTGTLSGTATLAATAGVATFSGLSIEKTGTGYTLAATSSGLTGATSSAFNITPAAAAKLAFTAHPSSSTAGSAFSTQPAIQILDAYDNLVTGSTATVALALDTNPGSSTLSGTASLAATAGVATFSALSLDKVGAGYTLAATSAGLTGATSNAFNITHAPASQLVFTTQPGGATAGIVFTQQPVVEIRDAHGNRVISGTDAGAILAMSLTTGTGTLITTTSQMAVLGVATWSDLEIDAYGTKVLTATKPDLTGTGGTGLLSVASDSFVNATNPPAVPTGLAANTGDAAVAMSWGAVSGAASYNILRGTSSGSLTLLATSATNTYTDTTPANGTTYYYAVQAVSPGGTSASSSEISARPVATSAIGSVTVSGAGALTIAWNTGAGAANYEVRYATTAGGASTGTSGCAVAAPTLTCAVSGLTAGTTYYFSVVSTNAVGGGAMTASAAAMGVPLATPTLGLSPASRQITPTFAAAGATSYDLAYGTSTGSYSTTVAGATSGAAVTGLINGTTYYFRVTAVNAYGSLNSAEQSTAPNGPQAFSLSGGTPGNGQVALTWGASTGATSYTVRYGTSSGSYGSTFATGVAGTSSTVTGLANGTTYYFMVTAVNANGTQDSTVEWIATPAQPTLGGTQNLTSPTLAAGFTARVPFTLGGLSTLTCADNVSATSSNGAVFATGAITISGTYPNCLISATVGASVTGATTVTLTATYGSATATANYTITFVNPVAAAYSVRRFVLGYNGPVLRIRHGTNNAEGDVAFDGGNTIGANSVVTITAAGTSGWSVGSTRTLSAFHGSDSAFVKTWYDQTGNGHDVTNATANTQPRLVNAGTIESLNSRPAVNYTAMMQTLAGSTRIVSSVNEYAALYVGASAVNNSTPFSLNGTNTSQRLAMHIPEGTSIMSDLCSGASAYNRQTGSWSGLSYNTGMIVAQVNSTASNVRQVRINGAVNVTTTATNFATTIGSGTLQLGATLYGSGYAYTGKFSEFVVMTANALSTTTALETAGKAYFGTP